MRLTLIKREQVISLSDTGIVEIGLKSPVPGSLSIVSEMITVSSQSLGEREREGGGGGREGPP